MKQRQKGQIAKCQRTPRRNPAQSLEERPCQPHAGIGPVRPNINPKCCVTPEIADRRVARSPTFGLHTQTNTHATDVVGFRPFPHCKDDVRLSFETGDSQGPTHETPAEDPPLRMEDCRKPGVSRRNFWDTKNEKLGPSEGAHLTCQQGKAKKR